MTQWGVYEKSNCVVIQPAGEDHGDMDCVCEPVIEMHDKPLIIHNEYGETH